MNPENLGSIHKDIRRNIKEIYALIISIDEFIGMDTKRRITYIDARGISNTIDKSVDKIWRGVRSTYERINVDKQTKGKYLMALLAHDYSNNNS